MEKEKDIYAKFGETSNELCQIEQMYLDYKEKTFPEKAALLAQFLFYLLRASHFRLSE